MLVAFSTITRTINCKYLITIRHKKRMYFASTIAVIGYIILIIAVL